VKRVALAMIVLTLCGFACSRSSETPGQAPPAHPAPSPSPATPIARISDLQIRQSVQDALKRDTQTSRQEILVEVGNGTVNLAGIVDTLRTKNEAESVARRARGTRGVINLLVVREAAIPPVALKDKIEGKIASQPLLKDDRIHITMSGTMASLNGSVDSGYEQWFAEEMASAVPGVTGIENHLGIRRPKTTRADSQIERAIERLLTTDPRLTMYNAVSVQVENGVASLAGRAQDQEQQKLIIADAFQAGAARVINETEAINGPPLQAREFDRSPVTPGPPAPQANSTG
jgi:osmotically-inducible protein OsmY